MKKDKDSFLIPILPEATIMKKSPINRIDNLRGCYQYFLTYKERVCDKPVDCTAT